MFTTNDWIVLITILAYMAIMIAIGFVVSKKNKTSSDFFLGGRQLGPLVTAMSAEASDMSGWLLMGMPGLALMTGVPEKIEAELNSLHAKIAEYKEILASSERIYSIVKTEMQDIARRFGDGKKVLTCISALMIVVFFIPYTASGFCACGKLFSSLFGMDYMTAMIISAAVIILYCTLGGFFAASFTDFVQSIIMTVALLIVLGLGEGLIGGFDKVFANVSELSGYLNVFEGYDVAKGVTGNYNALTVASTLAWGLGYFGMPHILLRFMAIGDEKKLKLSRRVASVWVTIAMGVAILIGIIGFSLMKNGIVPSYADNAAAESVIVDIAKFLSKYGYVAAFAGGIVLAGILASTMSTADSQLLAAASSISENLVQESFGVKLSVKKSMLLARISVVVISIIAIFLARNPDSSVFRIVSFAWAGFGAAFGPVVLCALFWRRANKYGAVAGMVSGGAMVFIWKFLVRPAFAGTILDIYELLPAFLLNLAVIIVVSLLTKAPDKELTDKFDEIKAECKSI